MAAQVAETVRAGLPLEAGLRALAEELPSARRRAAILRLCDRLEAGESLESALASVKGAFPPDLAAVLATARQAGFAETFEEYARQQQVATQLRWQAAGALAYPALLVLAAAAMLLGALVWLVPQFMEIHGQFDTRLPRLVLLLDRLSRFVIGFGGPVLIVGIAVAIVIPLMATTSGGRRMIVGAFHSLPLIGTAFRDIELSRFCRMLALLIDRDATLPAALRAAARVGGNGELRSSVENLASAIESGASTATAAIQRLPAPVRHALRQADQGSRPEVIARSLRSAAHALEARCRARLGTIVGLAEPLVVVAVGALIAVGVVVMVLPMIHLISMLSS
ncbi:MAG: type II secretion system F family protein [Planctomycetaceae bacterium]